MGKTKVCSKCGNEYPLTKEYFNKKSRKHGSKDGFRSDCRVCRSKSRRKSYADNVDHFREYQRTWYANNPDKALEYTARQLGLTPREYIKRKQKRDIETIVKSLHIKAKKTIQSNLAHDVPDIDIFGQKKCTECGEWKPNTEEYFHRRKASFDGFRRICSTCLNKRLHSIRRQPLKFNSPLCRRLSKYDKVRNHQGNNGYAQVRCAYCGKWITPTKSESESRVSACETQCKGENRIYCPGDQCRIACPTYGQQLYPKGFKNNSSREVDPLVRHMCMERDNYTCQRCGAGGEGVTLHAHHILSYAKHKILANDIHNVITLCKECHDIIHHEDGCKYHELKCG